MQKKSKYPHLNIYRTPPLHDALETVYAQMLRDGKQCQHGGKMNASAVVLYALQQTAKAAK